MYITHISEGHQRLIPPFFSFCFNSECEWEGARDKRHRQRSKVALQMVGSFAKQATLKDLTRRLPMHITCMGYAACMLGRAHYGLCACH